MAKSNYLVESGLLILMLHVTTFRVCPAPLALLERLASTERE